MAQQPVERHRPRRLSILGPIILIALGALLLLNNLGLLPWGFWSNLWRFWPVLLILLGIEFLFSRSYRWIGLILAIIVIAAVIAFAIIYPVGSVLQTSVGASATEQISEQAGNLTSATVNIEFGAGDLSIASLPGDSSSLVEASVTHGDPGSAVRKQFSQSNGVGRLSLRRQGSSSFQFGATPTENWDVKLSPGLPLDLQLKTGASRNTLDLSDLNIRQLNVDVGAGSAQIKLPRQGSTVAQIKGGASDLTLEIPDGVASRVAAKIGVGSFNIDESRFPKNGSYYVSNDFDSAANKLDLSIEGGVANITVR